VSEEQSVSSASNFSDDPDRFCTPGLTDGGGLSVRIGSGSLQIKKGT
jgi:hypothetical protein